MMSWIDGNRSPGLPDLDRAPQWIGKTSDVHTTGLGVLDAIKAKESGWVDGPMGMERKIHKKMKTYGTENDEYTRK